MLTLKMHRLFLPRDQFFFTRRRSNDDDFFDARVVVVGRSSSFAMSHHASSSAETDVDRAMMSANARLRAMDEDVGRRARAIAGRARAHANEREGGQNEGGSLGVETMKEREREALGFVEKEMREIIAVAEARVALAQATYDVVDDAITRLDRDLAMFEENIRAKDRVYDELALRNGGVGFTRAEMFCSTYDEPAANPNEPTYCVCQQVSFGEMIACENDDCPIEWYHFSCVGLSVKNKVKGRWVCPTCKKREGTASKR